MAAFCCCFFRLSQGMTRRFFVGGEMIEMEQRTFPVFSSFSFQLFGLEALDFFVDEYSWSSQEQLEVLDQVRLEDVQSEHQRHLGFRLFPVLLLWFGFRDLLQRGKQDTRLDLSVLGKDLFTIDESCKNASFVECIDMVSQWLSGKCWCHLSLSKGFPRFKHQ